ncbi:LuxR C-terminal-related transcriptional regulator [Polymorphospora sp. NPDC051019]|uniref:response regulator transcription factor n=1 Tax=Polymorphospora sp. NPDC051019 TaxID=3155725 RepID=UPI00341B5409
MTRHPVRWRSWPCSGPYSSARSGRWSPCRWPTSNAGGCASSTPAPSPPGTCGRRPTARGRGCVKDRVVDVEDFVTALRQVVDGGTVVDPHVVRQLLRRNDPLTRLSARERELVAEGHSNTAIARQLVISEAAVGKHVGNILAKLDLPPTDDTNRRVLAVLAYLRSGSDR